MDRDRKAPLADGVNDIQDNDQSNHRCFSFL